MTVVERPIVVACTGASGAIYGVRLLEVLLMAGQNVHFTLSPSAAEVLQYELDRQVRLNNFAPEQLAGSPDSLLSQLRPGDPGTWHRDSPQGTGSLTYHFYQDYSAGIASGSFLTAGMVICPCSMGTLAAVAGGLSTNLIQRAADVHLKERRKLIVVPRETPLGSIQLENMRRLVDAGGVVLPAMPAFYHRPQSLDDLVNFVVGRICDQLGLSLGLFNRWGTPESETPKSDENQRS